MIKIVWSYWHGQDCELLEKCLESWKRHLVGWEIKILDRNTVKKYIIKKPRNYEKLTESGRSDVIRLNLLYEYGGIWLDRAVILNKSFDWLKKYERYSYFGFILKPQKFIENWFIMVPKKRNKYIGYWREVLIGILENSPVTNHIAYKSECGYPKGNERYFMMYQAFCYLLDSNREFKKIYESIPFIVLKSRIPNIPFVKGFRIYSTNMFYYPYYSLNNQDLPIIKFTSGGRKVYNNLKFCNFYLSGIFITIAIIIFFIIMMIKKK